MLPLLDAARQVRVATGENNFFAWLDGLGLSATPALAPLAQEAYDRTLVTRLLPALAARLAALDLLLRSVDESQLDTLREVFRAYLMLGRSRPFRPSRCHACGAHRSDRGVPARSQPRRGDEPSCRPADGLAAEAVPDRSAPCRGTVRSRPGKTSAGRSSLCPPAARRARENPRLRPIDIASILGTGSLETTAPRAATIAYALPNDPNFNLAADGASIGGIFTRDGFYDFVLPRLPVLVREEQGADWIVAGSPTDDANLQIVTRQVMDRYVSDYIRTWNNALSSIVTVKFSDLRRGLGRAAGTGVAADTADPAGLAGEGEHRSCRCRAMMRARAAGQQAPAGSWALWPRVLRARAPTRR